MPRTLGTPRRSAVPAMIRHRQRQDRVGETELWIEATILQNLLRSEWAFRELAREKDDEIGRTMSSIYGRDEDQTSSLRRSRCNATDKRRMNRRSGSEGTTKGQSGATGE